MQLAGRGGGQLHNTFFFWGTVSYENVLTNAVDDPVQIRRGTRVSDTRPVRAKVAALKSLQPVLSLQSCAGSFHCHRTFAIFCTPMTWLRYICMMVCSAWASVSGARVEGFVLRLALRGQWLDDLGNEAWEIALEVRRVFALDDVVAVLITVITGLSSQTLCDQEERSNFKEESCIYRRSAIGLYSRA